jgi:CDP-paratose 2-epimerase
MTKKIYLITGGCGFLGSNIAEEIIRRGDKVVIFDNLSRLGSEKNLGWLKKRGDFQFVRGDIRIPYEVEKVVVQNKPDVIFHLAGQVAMTTSLDYPRMDFEINALGTLNLLEAVRHWSPHSVLIYSSTNKVYGDLEKYQVIESESRYLIPQFPKGFSEEVPLDFHSPYGCSKGAADQYVLDYGRMFHLKTVVFRHSSMFGGRQFSTYDQGWIGWFCQKALEQSRGSSESFTISGTGKQVRDVLYASDMVNLYLRAAEGIGDCFGEAFNIGGGMDNSLSILELLSFLSDKLNIKIKFKNISVRSSDQKVFVSDLSKVRRFLDWSPKLSWQDGILQMLNWLNGQGE